MLTMVSISVIAGFPHIIILSKFRLVILSMTKGVDEGDIEGLREISVGFEVGMSVRLEIPSKLRLLILSKTKGANEGDDEGLR